MEEIWKPIVGWEGLYEASTHGRIRSLDRVVHHPLGPKRRKGALMKQSTTATGYRFLTIRKDGRGQTLFVHRLVLEAFVGPCPQGMECRHMDGNSSNNRLENLSWGTARENAADRDTHGTTARGERHGQSKLTEGDIHRIRSALNEGQSMRSLAREFGVSLPAIRRIAHGKTWRQV